MWHVEFPVESDLEPSTVWGSLIALDGQFEVGGTRLVRRLEITGSSADDQAAIAGPASARTTPRQSPRFSGWRDRACDG